MLDGGVLLPLLSLLREGERRATTIRTHGAALFTGATQLVVPPHSFQYPYVLSTHLQNIIIRRLMHESRSHISAVPRYISVKLSLIFITRRCCVQLFGCVDWAPSDLIATFLLAGVAQTCRRRSKVELIAAAGGVPAGPPRQSPSRDGESLA